MGIEPTTFSLGSWTIARLFNGLLEKSVHRPLSDFKHLPAGRKNRNGDPTV